MVHMEIILGEIHFKCDFLLKPPELESVIFEFFIPKYPFNQNFSDFDNSFLILYLK
jgi:hypothetical protein